MAFSGIAASLYDGGRTVHNAFSLPLECTLQCNVPIPAKSTLERHLKTFDVFIIDEAPMTPRAVLEAINRYLQDIHKPSTEDWGGKIMILAGDRRQTTPVLRGGSTEALLDITIHTSPLLFHAHTHYLHKNERIGEGQEEHREWVLQVGDGKVDNEKDRSVFIPARLHLQPGETNLSHTYPPETIFHQDNDKEDQQLDVFFAECAILCPTNEVAQTNQQRRPRPHLQ
jgi:hypothetical protein